MRSTDIAGTFVSCSHHAGASPSRSVSSLACWVSLQPRKTMNPPQQHLVNEKGRDLLPPPVPAAAPKATAADQRQARLPLFLGLSAVLLFVKALPYFFGSSIPVPHTQNCDHDRGILRSPNSTIRWKTCPDTPTDDTSRKQLCSSLQVPLNWLNPVKGETADIFLRMYPADEGKRMGSMLVSSFSSDEEWKDELLTMTSK
jgi:hypothetical protein